MSLSTLFLRQAVVTLTDAQIKALPTTPIAIIPAPGATSRIVVIFADVSADFTAGAYTNINANDAGFSLNVGSFSQTSFVANDNGTSPALTGFSDFFGIAKQNMAALTIDLAGPSFSNGWGTVAIVHSDYSADLIDVALILDAWNTTNGNLTGGNAANTMTIRVFYTIVDVP